MISRSPILLLEDDRPTGRLAEQVLSAAGIANPINWVQWGTDAIAFLDQTQQQPELLPVLCVLDLALPDVSGLSVLAHVRQEPRTRNVPVIMLTGSGQDSDIDAAYRLGISAYLIKPAGIHGLADVVSELGLSYMLLPSAGRAPAPPDQRQLGSRHPSPSPALEFTPRLASGANDRLLDPGKIASLHALANNPAVGPRRLREVLTTFRHDAADGVIAVHRAIAGRDPTEVEALAHRLAGSAGITGADILCKICAQLEHQARQGFTEELIQLSYRLDALLEQTWTAIEREFAVELGS